MTVKTYDGRKNLIDYSKNLRFGHQTLNNFVTKHWQLRNLSTGLYRVTQFVSLDISVSLTIKDRLQNLWYNFKN